MKLLDEYLAKAIESGRNLVALSCSIKLINAIVSAEKRETPITDKDLLKTKDTLYRLAANVKLLPDSSAQLLEPFRLNPKHTIHFAFIQTIPTRDTRMPTSHFQLGATTALGRTLLLKRRG